MDTSIPRFMHRLCLGSVDSICTWCSRTIANAEHESELAHFEHNCWLHSNAPTQYKVMPPPNTR